MYWNLGNHIRTINTALQKTNRTIGYRLVEVTNHVLRLFWRRTITLIMFAFLKITVKGVENLPEEGEMPLILVANHFSYLDPIILTSRIPRRARFLGAIEMTRVFFFSHLLKVFEGIPVNRGKVDRQAIKASINHLENGGLLGVFPEGGIMPNLQEKIARGEEIIDAPNSKSRLSAVLAKARPGTAFIAAQTNAYMLPVAMTGTQYIEANIKRFPWKRTHVTIVFGRPYGPIEVDPTLKGQAKRHALEQVSELMMAKIAELMPVENRGSYVEKVQPNLDCAIVQSYSM